MSDLKLSKTEIEEISQHYATDNVTAINAQTSQRTARDDIRDNHRVFLAILAIAGATYLILRAHQNSEGEVMIFSS